MSMMKSGAEGLCQGISCIDDAMDVRKHNFFRSFPLLDGKVLNVDVASTGRGAIRIDHEDSGGVVFEQCGWTELRVA